MTTTRKISGRELLRQLHELGDSVDGWIGEIVGEQKAVGQEIERRWNLVLEERFAGVEATKAIGARVKAAAENLSRRICGAASPTSNPMDPAALSRDVAELRAIIKAGVPPFVDAEDFINAAVEAATVEIFDIEIGDEEPEGSEEFEIEVEDPTGADVGS